MAEPHFVSRAMKIDDRTWMVVEGTSQWNALAFEPGLLGREARWWLLRDAKRAWWPWWKLAPPPPVTSVRMFSLSPVDRALGWALAVWVLWRSLAG